MVDWETPLERSSSVSFDGVRATVKRVSAGLSLNFRDKHLDNVRALQEYPASRAWTKAAALHPPVAPKKATRGLVAFTFGVCMAAVSEKFGLCC